MIARTADPERLAGRVARAARRERAARTLLLDLDGTLVPLGSRPEETQVPDVILEWLRQLRGSGWRIVIVSGRAADSAQRLVPLAGVLVFGSHGLEGPWPDALRPRVDERLVRRISDLGSAARALAASVPGAWFESKPTGFAIHDRAAGSAQRAHLRRSIRFWMAGLDLSGVDLLPGKRVLEVRAAGVHKGRVLQALGVNGRRRLDASLLAFGDDRSDEDLFRALGGRGLTVHVGRPGAGTIARLRLPSPRGVASFLRHLARASDEGTG